MRGDVIGGLPEFPGLGRLAITASPLPSTILAARALIEDADSATAGSVLRLVRHDPVAVAGTLRVANAAHYGTQRTILGIERAVELLGPLTVLGIVTGMHLASSASPAASPSGACFLRLARHSVSTAYLAEVLNGFLATPWGSDTAYTAGLLHDLGRILIASQEPAAARSVYDDTTSVAADSEDELIELEQIAFGYDHTEAGEFAARRLNFPDLLVSAIRHHHRPDGAGPDPQAIRLARLVGLADAAASTLGWPARNERPGLTLDLHAAWSALAFTDLDAARTALAQRAESLRADPGEAAA